MTPHQALDNLLQGKRVKLTEEYFKELQGYWDKYDEKLEENDFSIYQIEECSVNIHSKQLEEVIYDIPYSELLNIE